MTAIKGLKTYFGMSGEQALKEIKALSHKEREELGKLACEAMNEPFEGSTEHKPN